MEKIEIRPRFHYSSTLPPETILQLLQEALDEEEAPIEGLVIDNHVYLRIPSDQQHFWSPQLNLEIVEDGSGTMINGLFGPRESVWLMYLFFYALLAFLIMIVMIMGFSQLNLGLSARILWALPVLILLFILAYVTARTGQTLGKDEMNLLYSFFTSIITAKG